VTLWRTFLVLLWCAVVVFAAVLVGEDTGLLDASAVGQVIPMLPLGPGAGALRSVAAATPTPAPVGIAPTPAGSQAEAETCTPGQPAFVHGAAMLKAALGAIMGDPTECERVTNAAGDTEQQTTTGLVYYRSSTNAVAFTNGFDHWALAPRGVVHWTGDAVDPPASAEPFG
jgi:hypothetical protein